MRVPVIKGWSLPYAQYLELRPGSQCGHWVTKDFAVRSQGHKGFPSGHSQIFCFMSSTLSCVLRARLYCQRRRSHTSSGRVPVKRSMVCTHFNLTLHGVTNDFEGRSRGHSRI